MTENEPKLTDLRDAFLANVRRCATRWNEIFPDRVPVDPDAVVAAAAAAFVRRGKRTGGVLASAPSSFDNREANAAWNGIMVVANPFKAQICNLAWTSPECRAISTICEAAAKVTPGFSRRADRDRNTLETIGVW